MRVYIAGPMTGRLHYNVSQFNAFTMRWRDRGDTVVTPFDAANTIYRAHFGRDFDPREDRCDYGSPLIRAMFAEDVRLLLSSDAVALIPGWEHSRGTARELAIADLFDIPIYDAATGERLTILLPAAGSLAESGA